MSKRTLVTRVFAAGILLCGLAIAKAQTPAPTPSPAPLPYGANVSLENARKAAAPALAEAEKNHWTIAVAIVDTSGNLVYYEKMDNTQLGSAQVAIDKARCAAAFKRPTKAFQDVLAAGGEGLRVLSLKGVVAVEGGIPLVMDGKIVGAMGVSGMASSQDAQCAKAGVDVLK
ncbi:MAG: heme-binding protein [Candidatus Acidiferrum sp.]|jgi:glc operon protein GlcG